MTKLARAVALARMQIMTIEHRIEPTERHLLAEADGDNPPRGDGGVGGELDVPADLRGGPTSPTEAQALRRVSSGRDLAQLRRLVGNLIRSTKELEAFVRSHGGEPVTREFVDRLRCANPTKICRHIADPTRDDRLCVEHGAEADRTEREQRQRQRRDSDARRQRRYAS